VLYVGTETGVYFSLDDGAGWTRMGGGFPNVPVYDLKVKGSDLVAGTHGRSFWVMDDLSPLRELVRDQKETRLIAPRPTVRTKLAWSAGMSFTKSGVSYSPAFGIGAGTEGVEFEGGRRDRHYLDVGENPPPGAIVYYWLDKDADGPVKISFQDAQGKTIVGYASDDKDAPFHKKPAGKAGLNRFLWDLKTPGPTKIDKTLVTQKYKPLAAESDDSSGPAVVPGSYRAVLEVGGKSHTVSFTVIKDPRIGATDKDFSHQFELLQRLYGKLSSLNQGVNRVRFLKRQVADLERRLDKQDDMRRDRTKALMTKLEKIEGALVDKNRETPRDVLRNPAGLNDTLVDLINTVAIADNAPTQAAKMVSDEVMGRIDGRLVDLDTLIKTDVAALNDSLKQAGIEVLGTA
jgi:hypothetical protein